jgi:N-acyl-D-aspartate/D-glutamate deacylase
MLSRVEGMSIASLREGLRFAGGGFADFWDRYQGRIGVNVGAYVGHSAVRRFVMGDDASERTASGEEIERMKELVRGALREGAVGFSSSQLDIHVADDGREVPSNHASPDELLALCAVLAEFGRGAIEFIPRSFAEGYNERDRSLLREMYRVSGRPIELNLLAPLVAHPMGWQRTLEFAHEAQREGIQLHPMFATNKLGAHLRLADTFLLDELPSFRDTLVLAEPERSRRLRDSALREQMRRELAVVEGRAVVFSWDALRIEAVERPDQRALVGRTVAEVAQERGADPLDVFLDVSLVDDLMTRFELETPPAGVEFMRHVTLTCVQDPIVMAGSSDAGAHLLSFVGADYTTRLLTEWVPEALSLEAAVSRLTRMPAVVHGLTDRGVVREGAAADLNLIEFESLAASDARLVADFPAGSSRYVVDAEGYRATIVNGAVLMEDGEHTGALPGHLIRG